MLPAARCPNLAPAPGGTEGVRSLLPVRRPADHLYVDVSVPAGASGEGTNKATVSGGGASAPAGDTDQVPFVPTLGLRRRCREASWPSLRRRLSRREPTRQASDHPFELRVDFDVTAKTGVNNEPGDPLATSPPTASCGPSRWPCRGG